MDGFDAELGDVFRRIEYEAHRERLEDEAVQAEIESRAWDLRARAVMSMMAGEPWTVRSDGHTFTGWVAHPGQDFLTLIDADLTEFDVRLSSLQDVHVGAGEAGASRAITTLRPSLFRTRLLDLENRSLVVAVPGARHECTIVQVNADHVEMRTRGGQLMLVPESAVLHVVRYTESRRRR